MTSAVRCLALALVVGLASLFSLTLQDAVMSASVVPNGTTLEPPVDRAVMGGNAMLAFMWFYLLALCVVLGRRVLLDSDEGKLSRWLVTGAEALGAAALLAGSGVMTNEALAMDGGDGWGSRVGDHAGGKPHSGRDGAPPRGHLLGCPT